MRELSLHILDIVQNSLSANASLICIDIIELTQENLLKIEISDNGKVHALLTPKTFQITI